MKQETIQAVNQFRDERHWRQFHNPKDLAISISLEASELLELFQWKTNEEVVGVKAEQLQEELGKSQAFIAHKFSPFILSNFNMTIWPPSIPLVGSLRFPLLCSSCPLQFPPFSHVSHTAYADSPISRKQARKATSLLIYPSIFRG